MTSPPASYERIRARLGAFPDREAFITGYAPFIAAEGILMRAKQLRPPGTPVELELLLADGSPVFQCTGEVTEHRPIGRAGALAMFIGFDTLSPEAQSIVDDALAYRRRKRRTTASQKAARRTGPQMVASGSFRAAQPSDAQTAVVDDVAGSLESSLDDIFGDFGDRASSGSQAAVPAGTGIGQKAEPSPGREQGAARERASGAHRTLPAIHPFHGDESAEEAGGDAEVGAGSSPTPTSMPAPAPEEETAPMPLHVATTTEPQQAAPAPKLAARIRRLTGAQQAIATSDQPVARRTRQPTPPPLPPVASSARETAHAPSSAASSPSPDAPAHELELDLGVLAEEEAPEAAHAETEMSEAHVREEPETEVAERAPQSDAEDRDSGTEEKRPGFWSRLFGRGS